MLSHSKEILQAEVDDNVESTPRKSCFVSYFDVSHFGPAVAVSSVRILQFSSDLEFERYLLKFR